MKACECGRIGVHCPQCGSVSKSGLSQQTILLTARFRGEIRGLRAYRCRACPTQYVHCDWDGKQEDVLGCFDEGVWKSGCFAPKKDSIVALPQQDIQDPKAVMEAFRLIEALGYKVVKEDSLIESQPKLEPIISREYTKEQFETLSDLFKIKEPSKDE